MSDECHYWHIPFILSLVFNLSVITSLIIFSLHLHRLGQSRNKLQKEPPISKPVELKNIIVAKSNYTPSSISNKPIQPTAKPHSFAPRSHSRQIHVSGDSF